MIETSLRSDKRVNPKMRQYELLSYDECKALKGHAQILDRNGKVANVKITSVKTWKTRPNIEVRCQFGLYEFFTVKISPDTPNTELVKDVTPSLD